MSRFLPFFQTFFQIKTGDSDINVFLKNCMSTYLVPLLQRNKYNPNKPNTRKWSLFSRSFFSSKTPNNIKHTLVRRLFQFFCIGLAKGNKERNNDNHRTRAGTMQKAKEMIEPLNITKPFQHIHRDRFN